MLIYLNLYYLIPCLKVDGIFLPKDPVEILEAGEFDNSTEILIGTNEDEGI